MWRSNCWAHLHFAVSVDAPLRPLACAIGNGSFEFRRGRERCPVPWCPGAPMFTALVPGFLVSGVTAWIYRFGMCDVFPRATRSLADHLYCFGGVVIVDALFTRNVFVHVCSKVERLI